MSSENSTAIYMQKKDLKNKYMIHTIQKQEQIKEVKATMKKLKKKYQRSYKMRCRLPSTNSRKAKQVSTQEMIRGIFNEVIKQDDCTHKKGNVEDVGNYHPSYTLPALYKLFSTILYYRLYPRLDHMQPEDQGGFHRSYQTLDHLATYRLIEQKCEEWDVEVCIATIDFMKAKEKRHGHELR